MSHSSSFVGVYAHLLFGGAAGLVIGLGLTYFGGFLVSLPEALTKDPAIVGILEALRSVLNDHASLREIAPLAFALSGALGAVFGGWTFLHGGLSGALGGGSRCGRGGGCQGGGGGCGASGTGCGTPNEKKNDVCA
jgi:hypothetical protein